MFALVSVAGRALGTDRARVPGTAGFAQAMHQPLGLGIPGPGVVVAPRVRELRPVLQEASWVGRCPGTGQETSLLAAVPAFTPALLFGSPPLRWLGAAPLPWGTAWLHPQGSHPTPSSHRAPQTQQD